MSESAQRVSLTFFSLFHKVLIASDSESIMGEQLVQSLR